MLRITHAQTETEQRWTLCGQLSGSVGCGTAACWEHGRQVAGRVHTVVNLSDVTFIDESGEKLLREMRSDGVEFVAAGIDTKHLLKHLKARGERQLRRFIAPQANCWETPDVTKNGRDK